MLTKTTRSVKAWATGLLLLSFSLFMLASYYEHVYSWAPWLAAWSEAAMVGACADWFAVTVLFRHPFGIPIPHTAIIPRNQGRIAGTLARFIQENFLTAAALEPRLKQAKLAERFTAWLSRPMNAELVTAQIKDLARTILTSIQDKQISSFVAELISSSAKKVKLAPLLAEVIAAIREADQHGNLFEELLATSEKLFLSHKELMNKLIGEELPWYIPGFIKNQVYSHVTEAIGKSIAAMRSNPNNLLRRQLAELTNKGLAALRVDEKWEQRLQHLAQQVSAHPALLEYLSNLRKKLLTRLESDSPHIIQEAITRLLQNAGDVLNADPALCARLNEAIAKAILRVMHDYRAHAGEFIEHTVRGWDSQMLVDKIEQEVGRDLQFIRINGTLVGGLVGLLLYATTLWIRGHG